MSEDILIFIEVFFFTCLTGIYLCFGCYLYEKFSREVQTKDEEHLPKRYQEKEFGEIATASELQTIINRKRGERYVYPLFGDSVNYTELQEMIEENK